MKKKIETVIWRIIYVIFIFLLFIVSIQKFSNNKYSLFGYRIFRVVSGSMYPDYSIGDVILIKNISTEKIKIGQDLVYKDENEMVITHRIIEIPNQDGDSYYITKGINNNTVDLPVYKNQIYGIVICKLYFLSFLNTIYGFILCIAIPVVTLIIKNIINLIKDDKESEK